MAEAMFRFVHNSISNPDPLICIIAHRDLGDLFVGSSGTQAEALLNVGTS